MGVPHFFKWLAKKYKSCFINKSMNVESDVLLLDNNCLIHPCTSRILEKYPNWTDLDVLEKNMCKEIINYMKKVYSETQANYLYIATDGPVPMAKMHQQRLRRYKAVSDKKIIDDIKLTYNKIIPNPWTNANITPGTKFMAKVNHYIKKHILKNNFDHAICVFNTSDIPGEGEHKIFGYLKKNFKLFQNKIKVIYGLDADLIFLSLISGFKNIFLMRENVELGNLGDNESLFNYIDIDKVRECIIKEMNYDTELKNSDNEKAYLELDQVVKQQILNDFVFITFLIGNDFLPNIWCLDVTHGGEDKIINTWKTCYKQLDKEQFIVNCDNANNKVNINYVFLGMFINVLSLGENNYYSYEIFKFMEQNSKMRCFSKDSYDLDMFDHLHMKTCTIYNPFKIGRGHIKYWRKNYYMHYFKNLPVDTICYKYIEGLHWIINYYFNSTPISWTWFYEYLASPLLIDLDNYLNKHDNIKFKFELGEPLVPHIQCLTVLPPHYSYLLIEELQHLVTDKTSKIIDMFPKRFREDRIHKTLAYKCYPIIPSIDLNRIIKEVSKIECKKVKIYRTMRYEPINKKKELAVDLFK
jgi:5'-3' exonuclease